MRLRQAWTEPSARLMHRSGGCACAAAMLIGACFSSAARVQQAVFGQGIPCGGYEVAAIIQAPDCQFTGPNPTAALGISPNGRYVCGVHGQCDNGGEAWIYDMRSGVMTTIPRPQGILSASARGVNDSAIVVGYAVVPNGGFRGFVYNLAENKWTTLEPLPGGTECFAVAINAAGQVTGWRSLGTGSPEPQSAFRWSEARGFEDLGVNTSGADINEAGTVTGTLILPESWHPFLWRANGEFVDIGSMHGFATVPTAINEQEVVVGHDLIAVKGPPFFINHAFAWSRGTFAELLPLGSDVVSDALGVSESGMAIGFSRVLPSGGGDRGCIWTDGQPYDIHGFLPSGINVNVRALIDTSVDGVLVGAGGIPSASNVGIVLAPRQVIADVDGNCTVDVDDLIAVILCWHDTDSPADVTHDGIVDVEDLILVVDNWTEP